MPMKDYIEENETIEKPIIYASELGQKYELNKM